jgi:hypothetical protein
MRDEPDTQTAQRCKMLRDENVKSGANFRHAWEEGSKRKRGAPATFAANEDS